MRWGPTARLGLCSGAALAAVLATVVATVAPAAPLDPQTCDQLKREVGELEGIGVRANLAKGAAWGKANLKSGQLEQVKKLIEMDEAIAFRCPVPKPPPPERIAAAPGKVKAKVLPKAPPRKSADTGVAAQEQGTAKPKPKAAVKPANASAVSADPNAPAPKPRPRPPAAKPQDAAAPPARAPAPAQ